MDVTTVGQTSPPANQDLQSVDASQWPQRAFPAGVEGRQSGVIPVVIRQSILNHIHLHGQQTTDVEICGVVIGRGYRDDEGPFVYIEGAIRGDHAESQVAQVTFTAETWNHIYAIADNAWPESRILGWYHTHPGFGIFLSGMDLFIHDNFFNSPEQFAIVYDPLSGEEGIFLWMAGKATRASYLIEPDEPENPPQRPPRRSSRATAGAGDQPDELTTEVARLRSNQTLLTFLIFAVGLLAISWPWVLFRWINVPNLPSPAPPQRTAPAEQPQRKKAAAPKPAKNKEPKPAPADNKSDEDLNDLFRPAKPKDPPEKPGNDRPEEEPDDQPKPAEPDNESKKSETDSEPTPED